MGAWATKFGGIYLIVNSINDKVYVGSTKRFSSRFACHRKRLRAGKHHAPHLQAAWDKYGEQNFTFIPLLICDVSSLDMYEERAINRYNSANPKFGYNVRAFVDGKHVLSESTKAKLSKINTGRKGYRLGVEVTSETRAKMREAKLGKPNTTLKEKWKDPEFRAMMSQRISAGMSNMTDDAVKAMKQRQSITRTGVPSPKRGIPSNPESVAKMKATKRKQAQLRAALRG